FLPLLPGESFPPSVGTTFMQDLASVGKVGLTGTYDQAGHILTQTNYLYTTNGATVPRTSVLATEWTTTFDGTGATCPSYPCANGKVTQKWYQYDGYGNVVRTDFSGDGDFLGDELTTSHGFYPNTTAYIVDRPAYEEQYSTAGQVKATRFVYDGQAAFSLPPIKGSVTTTMEWYGEQSRWVSTVMTYDAYGNLTSVTDPTNRTTPTAYDSSYHVFPISVTNGAAETQTSSWDPVCGVVNETTDANGQPATSQYDALCRVTRTDMPLGAYTRRAYLNFG